MKFNFGNVFLIIAFPIIIIVSLISKNLPSFIGWTIAFMWYLITTLLLEDKARRDAILQNSEKVERRFKK